MSTTISDQYDKSPHYNENIYNKTREIGRRRQKGDWDISRPHRGRREKAFGSRKWNLDLISWIKRILRRFQIQGPR